MANIAISFSSVLVIENAMVCLKTEPLEGTVTHRVKVSSTV